jgi:hypothetical protein
MKLNGCIRPPLTLPSAKQFLVEPGGWVYPRLVLDVGAKRKITIPSTGRRTEAVQFEILV